ncbi:SNF2 family N-terminal domain-domain-containing protein [Leucosporidium creatinivorum]|uniref:SNF2 family N-terminal domain-domain-containing protein n=1 Tax=Leucosporidium creatinivorum TaxID=106004 RepID=A0A1Y2EV72_9BASI|nr:SNF2 family N-terminal domain-domain-containing protein [Leucosporidium creatinivorum]
MELSRMATLRLRYTSHPPRYRRSRCRYATGLQVSSTRGSAEGQDGLDPIDIPAIAQTIDLTTLPDTPKKKRPRPSAAESPIASTSGSHLASSSQAGPSSTQMQPTPWGSGSISSSQLEIEEEEYDEEDEDQLMVVTRSQVVGVKYYRGLVSEGEAVTLQREPQNPYDPNAIRAMNMSGVQVGHIPKTVAARLAPLMDRQLLSVEGEMVQGNLYGNPFQLSIDIALYAPESIRDQLMPQLRWATPAPARRSSKLVPLPPTQNQTGVQGTASPQKGKGKAGNSSASSASSIAPEPGETAAQTAARQRQLQKVLGALQRINGEEKRGDEVLDALADVKDVLDLPFPKNPPGIASGDLNVDLLPHQQQGLRWMRRAEAPKLPKTDSDPPVQLIKYQTRAGGQSSYYLNLASRQPTAEEPKLARGGMLCDAMGLGKTLQVIALIVDTLEHEPEGFDKGTLVVAPVSVLSNWSKQIEDHVSASLDLKFHVYHGPGRDVSLSKLRKFDVVITAYPTLSGELADDSKGKGKSKAKKGDGEDDDCLLDDEPASKRKKKSNGKLMQVAWKRVVLDEGHIIKNPKAKVSKAACALNAYSRWVCTGTPIINSPSDLGSLLTFLRSCEPLSSPDLFKRLLLRPLASGDANGIRILKSVMSSISLRRTKEMSKDGVPLVKLPKIDFFVVSIELGKEQRQAYETVAEESKRYLKEFLQARDSNPNGVAAAAPTFANVLSLLTRMRQLCLHEDLLPAGYIDSIKQSAETAGQAGAVVVTPERMGELQKAFKQLLDDSEDCSICFDQMLPENARMLPCAHAFHLACLEEILKTNPLCPMDRGAITKSMFIEYQPPTEEEMEEDREIKKEMAVKTKASAKIEKLIELLRLCDPDSKSLVFSQFTRFLDLIEAHLDEAGISHCRFDGSMPQKKREAVIKSFSKPIDLNSTKAQSPQVMLISLKAGALGLNLTCASQVFLCDPWWQASIEAQAVDRTYRIGQQRNVKVFQLVAANSVEDKVLEIQARKEQLIQHAFSGTKGAGGGTAKQKKQSRLEDLRELFA